jgi:hypothetical protein
LNAGEQALGHHWWKIAGDAFVIVIKDDPAMAFLTDISVAQLDAIYEDTTNTLTWQSLNGAWPARNITPIARITGSGSQPDFLSKVGISASLEATTIDLTGVARQVESIDMADRAAEAIDRIAYTSLANNGHPGTRTITVGGNPPSALPPYALTRELFVATREIADVNHIDNTTQVLADDMVNFFRGATAQGVVNAEGFAPIGAATFPPFPDWDINLDGSTLLADLGGVAGRWGQTSQCKGWIRADANNSAGVSLGDIGIVTGHWGQPGFTCPGGVGALCPQ